MSEPRILCNVPGCTRYMKRETALKRWGTVHVRIMCAMHWRRLSKAERRVIFRFERTEKRFGRDAVRDDRRHRVWNALFRRASTPDRIAAELGLRVKA